MASLLIIGGTGFFGKSILDGYRRGLLDPWAIDSIFVLARNADQLITQAPELLDGTIRLINGDIASCSELPVADYVVHAAASTDAANYLSQPEVEKKNIQAGTYNYCELAKKFHRKSRIVYCSSGAVYGQQPSDLEKIPESFAGGPLAEMSLIKQDYAAAKRDAEEAIINLGKESLSVSIARCFAFVGPYLPRDKHFAVGNFIEDGLNKRSIQVKADHPVYRSYMHADDLVYWLMTICNNANINAPTYNVGSDDAVSMINLADYVASIFGVDAIKRKFVVNAIDRYVPSIDKAKMELGLKINKDFKKAIKQTVCAISKRTLHD